MQLEASDVRDLGTSLSVDVRVTKTGNSRQFVIGPGEDGLDFVGIVKKYIGLRPSNVISKRFFLNYQKGRCTRQPIGINKIAQFPKVIATFLNLPNPQSYTGHCFRRTSATLLVDAGGDLTTLKRHGGWKSSSVAEGYLVNSMTNKRNVSKKILGGLTSSTSSFANDPAASTSTAAYKQRASTSFEMMPYPIVPRSSNAAMKNAARAESAAASSKEAIVNAKQAFQQTEETHETHNTAVAKTHHFRDTYLQRPKMVPICLRNYMVTLSVFYLYIYPC